jgi:hypothetical protein
MKYLPIGVQSLQKIFERNCIYVDKTRMVHEIIQNGSCYFFSRPRRFGKSLLVSTFKELFKGNKTLFEKLWIVNHWDWSKKHPVIHISFDATAYNGLGMNGAIQKELDEHAENNGISLAETDLKLKFKELLKKLHDKFGKVVLLIDEYDKPIIDFLESDTIEQAKINQKVLREFYSVLKNADDLLQFVFITGVSKFSKTSLFSDLNNLNDITLEPEYATLTGYTVHELTYYFDDYLKLIEKKLKLSRNQLIELMRVWYDGYSWDGVHRVYNPFGTLNFLSHKVFRNYWFSTGTPTFLVKQMREKIIYDVENTVTNAIILDKYSLDNIELTALLFQTGYLTVKSMDEMTGDMVLDYPNKEVRQSMYQFLIDDLAYNPRRTHTGMTILDLQKALIANDLPNVRSILDGLLGDLPAETYQHSSEGLYHGLIHLIFSYLGMFAQSEVHSAKGRADAVVQTLTHVYIFEFKFNKTAQEGLDQIQNQGYARKYRNSQKIIIGIGVNFNKMERGIDDWQEQIL